MNYHIINFILISKDFLNIPISSKCEFLLQLFKKIVAILLCFYNILLRMTENFKFKIYIKVNWDK